jgi:hypothetical protein
MPSMFDPAIHQEFTGRIDRLTPQSQRQWGRMSVQQMVCHLTDAVKGTLGETPSSFKPNFLSSRLGHFIILNVPIPKGKAPTSPQFQVSQPGDWGHDVSTLKGYLARVVERARSPDAVWGIHPRFGKLTHQEWGKLLARHFDHHLRQFGV